MRDLSDIVSWRPGGIARAGLALVAAAVLMTALQPGTAQGRDAGRDPKAAESAGPVFARIARAFEDSDAAALAALVHGEGLRVTGHNERAGEYSPAQAVYFFRNLFQAQRTLVFAFRKTQDDAAGGFARGMADWKRRRIDSETVVEQQIVLRLARDDGQWRLVEINLIR